MKKRRQSPSGQSGLRKALNTALTHQRAGRLAEARKICQKILGSHSDNVDAVYLSGGIAQQSGDYAAAAKYFERATTINPSIPDFHNALGVSLLAQGQADQAIAALQRALALNPEHGSAHGNLGNAYQSLGRLPEAVRHFERIVALSPQDPNSHHSLGRALLDQGEHARAAEQFAEALKLKPGFAKAHLYSALALFGMQQRDTAVEHLHKALALDPNMADAHYNLGVVLHQNDQFDAAIRAYTRAIESEPGYITALYNLGTVLQAQGRLHESAAQYQKVLARQPEHADAHNNLAVASMELGRHQQAIEHYQLALVSRPDFAVAASNRVFAMNYAPDYAPATIYAEHQAFASRFAEPLTESARSFANDPDPQRKLKIGYVSPDLRQHAVAHFIEPVLSYHDHAAVAVYAYSNSRVEDTVSQRLRSHTEGWHNISRMSDEAVAQQIRDDGIDVLVDLAGHTQANRLLVFAHRPAPVQMTWLGYLNTTGLATMDYRLTDRVASPPGMFDDLHSETLAYLPDSQWCYQPPDDTPAVTALPALQTGQLTFASTHNLAKVTPEVFGLWARLLTAIPTARLIVLARGAEDLAAEIQQRFADGGVVADRLELIDHLAFRDYLALHDRVDINLDTFPYTGGTTTCHSLWMGVPVISLAGERTTSRGGASLLSAVGLPEFIATSEDDYIGIAKRNADDLQALSALRKVLRERVGASPLLDAKSFTRHLEQIYRDAWTAWCTPP